jgi:hypothetical protein
MRYSAATTMSLRRLRCLFGGHQYRFVRAIDRLPEAATREYADDRPPEPIDSCTIIDKCARCGTERETTAAVCVAERFDISREWEEPDDK